MHSSLVGVIVLNMKLTKTMSLLAALLATGSVQLGVVGTVSALDDTVCAHWRTTVRSYIDDEGNDWTEIEASCDFWLSFGDHGVTTHDHGDGGVGPGVDIDPEVDPKEYCEALGRDIDHMRTALALAQGEIERARQTADDDAHDAAEDYSDYQSARERPAEAQRAYAAALAAYSDGHDLDIELETRNGNTITRSAPIDISTPEGKALVNAQLAAERASAAEREAFQKWGAGSKPDAVAAQAEYTRLQSIIDDTPALLEQLQREHDEHCK